MSWTGITHAQYRRDGLGYASDATDEEWALIEPHLPPASPLGRPRATDLREVVNAVLYLLTGGCQWRMLPKEFPPCSTVQRFPHAWHDDGTWRRVHHALLLATREAAGREAGPSAGIIDSQSVSTTEAGGPRGLDAGKKVSGRMRHIVTDTGGLLVGVTVHAASIQSLPRRRPGTETASCPCSPRSVAAFPDGCAASPPARWGRRCSARSGRSCARRRSWRGR